MKKIVLSLLAFSTSFALTAQFSFSNQNDLLPESWGMEGEHPVSVADINGDGYDDLVVLDEYKIFFQDPAGGEFEVLDLGYEDAPSAWGMCVGDMNNDGYSDMLYGGYYNGLSVVMHSPFIDVYFRMLHDDEEFSVFLQGVNFADIDSDGNLDIYACHDHGPSRIYLGDGQGNFVQDTEIIETDLNGGGENDSGNYGSLFTDVNNDGLIDLYVAKCRQGVSDPTDSRRINLLYINNGDGTYTEQAEDWGINSGDQSWSADFGDIDNDGDFDLVLTQHSGDEFVEVFINNGDETFTDITDVTGLSEQFTNHPIQSKFADFDNDGYLDLLVSGGSNSMFAHNNGDSTFTVLDEDELNVYVSMNSFALGDLNHDGWVDVYGTPGGYGGGWGSSGNDSMYFNNGGDNHFLTFDLEGVLSNKDGIGARVTVYSPLGTQIRDVRSGESYGIQNSLTAHFGLGSLTNIDSAIVVWPSGIVDHYGAIETDQFINLSEGSSPVGIASFESQFDINVYPNPSSDFIRIEGGEIQRVEMMDTQGKMVMSTLYNEGQQLDLSQFEKGNYILRMYRDNSIVAIEKITLQ